MKKSRLLTRRGFLGTSFVLTCLPAQLFADHPLDVVLRFAAMSDVHFSENPRSAEVDRLTKALAFMYDYSSKQPYHGFDALLVAGDMTNHGLTSELTLFRDTMNAGLRQGTAKLLCMGNHEFIKGNKNEWEHIFGMKANNMYDVNGFKFLALSPSHGKGGDGDFVPSLPWLKQSLDTAVAADPKKPIFLFQHYHISETVYGSCGDDHWGTNDLRNFLNDYPQLIDFSGHSHYPINDPKSAWQGKYSAFGTGTLSYFEMTGGIYQKFPAGYRNAAQMYVVEVHQDNSIILKPYDVLTGDFFDLVYLISAPGKTDTYLYTDQRVQKAKAPVWKTKSVPVVKDIDSFEAAFEFPHAARSAADDIVHSYHAQLEKKQKGNWQAVAGQYIWSEYYFNHMPKLMTARLEGLDPDSEYRVSFSPIDAFQKEGVPLPSVEFKTKKDPFETVDRNADRPSANILNLQFEKTGIVNRAENSLKMQKKVEKFGSPRLVFDSVLQSTVACFNGQNDYYRIPFTQRDYSRLQNSITMAIQFRIDSFDGKSYEDVFANTEAGGYAFAIDHKEKTVKFWCSVNGSYVIVSHPFEAGQFVTAFGVYDGQNVILYLNGKEVAKKVAKGRITYPSSQRAFCLGCDIAHNGGGSGFFKGNVAWAKLFSWPLTSEQIKNLSEK